MDQYLVYGNPIAQSRSPFIHSEFAHQTKQTMNYQSQLVELEEFEEKVKLFIIQGGKGANVTAPFKERAMMMCDELSERARLAGAVNTLSFRNGSIFGDNTDGLGLVQDLLNHQVSLKDQNILILGAGGATKGVVLPLLEQQPLSITIANRTVSKAKQICQAFNNEKLTSCSLDEVSQSTYDLIINATSAGLSGNIPNIPSKVINKNVVCYDMVYAKQLTPFLSWAEEQGSEKLIDGLGMLVGQAAESFSIWRGEQPNVDNVLSKLRDAM